MSEQEQIPTSEGEPKGREITDKEAAEFARGESFETVFVGPTDREKRDAEGKLLPTGESVIKNPEDPGLVMEDTPQNRRNFIRHGFSWKFADFYAPREQKEKALIEGDVNDYFEGMARGAKDFQEKVSAVESTMLAQEKRDAEGKLLPKGCKIIADPVYEELVMEDIPENRARFVKQGGTWKEEKH